MCNFWYQHLSFNHKKKINHFKYITLFSLITFRIAVVVVDGVIAFIEGGEVLDVVEVAIGIVVVEIEVGVVVAFTVVNMSMVVMLKFLLLLLQLI